METYKVKVEIADPTVLGLFGLAIVTLVASSQKLDFTTGLSLIIPWALFLGGGAQLIASIIDFKRNNLFGATAFGAYGLFWWGVAMTFLIKMGSFGTILASNSDIHQLGFVFFGYLLLSTVLCVSALKMSKAMFLLMLLIVFLFVGLTLDTFGFGAFWHSFAGYSELSISIVTFYVMSSKYLNSFFGKEIIPVGSAFMK